jgi:DNA-binding NarL/FixJ family response regulator
MKAGLGNTVLLVEDHEQFRSYIRSLLDERHDLQVVGEAEDGLAGVDKCAELQPDFVLLDIGLPKLNGFQVARRIRQSAPRSRIVFLTQESSAEMAQEALSLGAAAYVIKAHTSGDLIPALLAARDGRSFVSPAVRGFESFPHLNSLKLNGDSRQAASSSSKFSHQVHFYGDNSSFVRDFAGYVERVLRSGKAFLALLPAEDNLELIRCLRSSGFDTAQAIATGRLVQLDSADITAQYMINGRLDFERTQRGAAGLVEMMERNNPGVPFCAGGAWAPLLLARGNVEAAFQVERIWDELGRLCDLEIFCGYVVESPQRVREMQVYRELSSLHSLVAYH